MEKLGGSKRRGLSPSTSRENSKEQDKKSYLFVTIFSWQHAHQSIAWVAYAATLAQSTSSIAGTLAIPWLRRSTRITCTCLRADGTCPADVWTAFFASACVVDAATGTPCSGGPPPAAVCGVYGCAKHCCGNRA
ncbi:expressed unknown protein [Ectocarpus siliculosus]|uniref:Uncharacterized protein n=1 Tax=Ectocarpus siliculosus TaxID=2880 RepID=D7FYT4_ECTSI|nr:expressed unknown protein [Ectocarpus siliculosus]|eukprot:CBJ26576.1 expressed unknown protein [Ectocarpus siliculosus]